MREILAITMICMAASSAWATESDEDRMCNARFAAAARYLKSASPEWKAMANHSIDLNRKYPEDWTDDQALETKRRHRADMDAVLGRIKSGETTIEQVFAEVNACETRLGMPVTTLAVTAAPVD